MGNKMGTKWHASLACESRLARHSKPMSIERPNLRLRCQSAVSGGQSRTPFPACAPLRLGHRTPTHHNARHRQCKGHDHHHHKVLRDERAGLEHAEGHADDSGRQEGPQECPGTCTQFRGALMDVVMRRYNSQRDGRPAPPPPKGNARLRHEAKICTAPPPPAALQTALGPGSESTHRGRSVPSHYCSTVQPQRTAGLPRRWGRGRSSGESSGRQNAPTVASSCHADGPGEGGPWSPHSKPPNGGRVTGQRARGAPTATTAKRLVRGHRRAIGTVPPPKRRRRRGCPVGRAPWGHV